MIMMFEGGMGRKLSTLFGKTPAEKAAALVFQLPGEKARGKLEELKADAVPALLALLRGTAEEGAKGANDEVRKEMRRAAAELVIHAGAPGLASLRPLILSNEMADKRLGYLLAKRILAKALEWPGAEEAERKAAGAEVLGMLRSVHGEEIRLGIAYAANVPGAETAQILGGLARDGWSAAQRNASNARMAEITEIKGLLVSGEDIGKRANRGAVPQADLDKFKKKESAAANAEKPTEEQIIAEARKPTKTIDFVEISETLARGYRIDDSMERNSTRVEAVVALGKIGNADAVRALIGLLDTVGYNPDVMTLGGLDCRIADELRGAVGRDPELMSLLIEAAKKWNAAERAEKEKVGVVSDSPERRKAAHISELLSGIL
jgi:hypothetical protein